MVTRVLMLILLLAFSLPGAVPRAEEGLRDEDHELGPPLHDRLQGETIQLSTADGKAFRVYAVGPENARRGILLVHEWWGLNDHIRSWADRFAGLGYRAMAVDLYNGAVATTPEDARRLLQSLDQTEANAKYRATLQVLKHPGRRLATIGWCVGGGQSLQASLNDPDDVAATVIYYGPLVTDPAKLSALKGPVLGIFAKRDANITVQKVAEFEAAMRKAARPLEVHFYDADHGFANPSGERFNGEAAQAAWKVTRAFLDQNLP